MRIAIFTEVFVPKIDGITNRLRNTIRCLKEQGHELLVFAPENAAAEYRGVRVVRVPGLTFPPYPELRISMPDPRIVKELWDFQPDVVHAVGPVCLGIWGMQAARALALPVVASYHTDIPAYASDFGYDWARPLVWPLLAGVHSGAHVNLAPSAYTCQELRDHGLGIVGRWRGGVDTRRFTPRVRSDDARFRLSGGAPDEPIILYAGRVSWEKGLDRFESVLEAIPNARVAIVGDGPARADLERRLDPERTVFTGFLRGLELAEAFASSDLFFMPSTTETLGFVVLEAMSAGCAVVAARAGGIPDLVDHGETGVLYDPDAPEQAISALRELCERPSMRRFYSQQGRKAALAADWGKETEGLVDHYRRAIAMNSQRGLLGRLHRTLLTR